MTKRSGLAARISGVGRGRRFGQRRMKTTLGLGGATPAARPVVFARGNAAGARQTADARISAVVQRVVGYVVTQQIRPDVFLGPANERVYLAETVLCVPFDCERLGASGGLVTADGGNPRIEPVELRF